MINQGKNQNWTEYLPIDMSSVKIVLTFYHTLLFVWSSFSAMQTCPFVYHLLPGHHFLYFVSYELCRFKINKFFSICLLIHAEKNKKFQIISDNFID